MSYLMSGRSTSRNWLETVQFGGLLEDRGKMAIEGLGGPERECKSCGSLLTVIHSAGRWGSWWIILKLSLLHSGYSWSFNNVTLCG